MQQLNDKQLNNLGIEQLDEIRRELGNAIGSLRNEFKLNESKADYTRMRSLEKYLITVKAVIQRKVNLRK